MVYSTKFTDRLRAVKNDFVRKADRRERDREAFEIFRKNHPVPTHNHRGKPRWEGSVVQKLLKQDMEAGLHVKMSPKQFWESRPEYREAMELNYFRDHMNPRPTHVDNPSVISIRTTLLMYEIYP